MMTLVDSKAALRQVKHHAYVTFKRLRWPVYEATEPLVQAWHRRHPYRYRPEKFAHTFLAYNATTDRETTEPVPRRIYCFWTGENEMSPERAAALDSMRAANPDVTVELITAGTLASYLLPDQPLHPAYEGLSYVHRADYLRCYFLHFFGGGYADIKHTRTSWTPAFDWMDASDAWLMGYRNPVRLMTPNFTDRFLQREMVRSSDLRLGQCAYIARPQTALTSEWWRELNASLDRALPLLGESPGATRSESEVGSYPIHWNGLLAQILDPLTVKYADHLLYEPSLLFDPSLTYI